MMGGLPSAVLLLYRYLSPAAAWCLRGLQMSRLHIAGNIERDRFTIYGCFVKNNPNSCNSDLL